MELERAMRVGHGVARRGVMEFVAGLLAGCCALWAGGSGIAAQQTAAKKITADEVKVFINGKAGVDECESLDQIYIDHLEYFDFTGDGQEEAVVVASTCMTGTAGPDIHAVYTREADGGLAELPFLDARGDPLIEGSRFKRTPVFGNPNYSLSAEDGKLVVRWRDASDREAPVVIRYKWDGKKFAVEDMEVEGPYPTSYDCSEATEELDLAICYSPRVAKLDVELGRVYRAALSGLPAARKQELQAQQRDWLARREKACTIYKWWVECLADFYGKRIEELKGK